MTITQNKILITLFKTSKLKNISYLIFLLTFVFLPQSVFAIVYVNQNATGLNDGSSWSNAYSDLRTALVNTVNDEVWIAAGTYKAAGYGGDILAHFPMKSGVAIYGGFNGSETLQTQRNPKINITILSGDLNNDDTYGAADGQFHVTDNTRNILVADGVDTTAVLDGVTLYHGYAFRTNYGKVIYEVGGGLLILNANPVINNVTFTENYATSGGAIFSRDSNPTVRNSRFNNNLAQFHNGGAIALKRGSTFALMTVDNCQFTGNFALGTSSFREGGGAIYIGLLTKMIISNSTFDNNKVDHLRRSSGNALFGGAISAWGALTVNHSKFINNQSHIGGAIFLYDTGIFNNVSFINNHAIKARDLGQFPGPNGGIGGALYINGSAKTNVLLSNITISKNTAQKFAAGILIENRGTTATSIVVNNSVLWGNTVTSTEVPSTLLEQQFATSNSATSLDVLISINYSDIQGLTPIDSNLMPGTIDSDPQFVDLVNNNNRLSQASPAIDSGNNCLIIAGTFLDLDVNGRRFDDIVTVDTGNGTLPIVDMGAFEFASPTGGLFTPDPNCHDVKTNPVVPAIELAGVIESVGNNFIVVNTVTVFFDVNTVFKFEDGTGGALAQGQLVQLIGKKYSDGSTLATFMGIAI